jgi:hypothetical protein
MSDETSRDQSQDDVNSATPNRDRREEPPVVIEGEVARTQEDASPPPILDAASSSETLDPSPEAAPSAGGRPILSAVVGALVGAAVAGAGVWFLGPRPAGESDLVARLENLERTQPASAPAAALSALEKRVGALEAAVSGSPDKAAAAAYGQRIEALESAALSAKAAADANKDAVVQAQSAHEDAAKALALATTLAKSANNAATPTDQAPGAPISDAGALEARIVKLEASLAALDHSPMDIGAVNQRLGKLEGELAAPKSETRVAAEPVGPNRDAGAALAVIAQSVNDRLRTGAPYSIEQTALEHLGADTAKLAILKPLAEKGAPTASALAAEFAKNAPAVRAASAPQSSGGVVDRLMSNMSKVIRVTPVGEVAGDDPAALVSQIDGALGRGQIAEAIAAWARLPDPARQASQDWAARAQSRVAADKAAQGVLDDAMAQLASTKN